MHKKLKLYLIGFAMGSADIVPGVSGGTIAFIAGIYEDLINNIKKASSETVRHLLKANIKKTISAIPFSFFIPLGAGILSAIFTLAHFLQIALAEYPVYIWSFFFGLIVASIFVVRKRIKSWSMTTVLIAVVFAVVAYAIVGLVPVETPSTPFAFFISGAIAICAMILPGISGSFLLLVMGKYAQILAAVTNFDIVTLGLVASGAVLGLAFFSRFLSWLFKHYHDYTIAALTGLMIGSLRKVWPWNEGVGDSSLFIAIALTGIGMLLIYFIERAGVTQE